MKVANNNHRRHGGAYDRGSADKYYNRHFDPHYYQGDTYRSDRIGKDEMKPDEIAAYTAGYNEEAGSKDWGVQESTKDTNEDASLTAGEAFLDALNKSTYVAFSSGNGACQMREV